MKLQEAMTIINKPNGFMVSFEKREGGLLKSDHFPDKLGGETLISTEDEAWILALKFANATSSDYVNIYVIDDNFKPVIGYNDKKFKRE